MRLSELIGRGIETGIEQTAGSIAEFRGGKVGAVDAIGAALVGAGVDLRTMREGEIVRTDHAINRLRAHVTGTADLAGLATTVWNWNDSNGWTFHRIKAELIKLGQ